jgi:hypothetical protein
MDTTPDRSCTGDMHKFGKKGGEERAFSGSTREIARAMGRPTFGQVPRDNPPRASTKTQVKRLKEAGKKAAMAAHTRASPPAAPRGDFFDQYEALDREEEMWTPASASGARKVTVRLLGTPPRSTPASSEDSPSPLGGHLPGLDGVDEDLGNDVEDAIEEALQAAEKIRDADREWQCNEDDEPDRPQSDIEEEICTERVHSSWQLAEKAGGNSKAGPLVPLGGSHTVQVDGEEKYGEIPFYRKEKRDFFCFLCDIESLDQTKEKYRQIISAIERLADKNGISFDDRPHWVVDCYNATFRNVLQKEWKVEDARDHFHLKHGTYTAGMVRAMFQAQAIALSGTMFKCIARYKGAELTGLNTETVKQWIKLVPVVLELMGDS